MTALATQRCFHHPEREAVARCPECTRFHCRECITEHEGRVICASCLRALASRNADRARGGGVLRVLAYGRFGLGLLVAWVFFYVVGRSLASLPDSFHEAEFWSLLNPESISSEDGE